MDWVALGIMVAVLIMAVGVYRNKVDNNKSETEELKEELAKYKVEVQAEFKEVDAILERHADRLNLNDVTSASINTSLRFIMEKLDGIDKKVSGPVTCE